MNRFRKIQLSCSGLVVCLVALCFPTLETRVTAGRMRIGPWPWKVICFLDEPISHFRFPFFAQLGIDFITVVLWAVVIGYAAARYVTYNDDRRG